MKKLFAFSLASALPAVFMAGVAFGFMSFGQVRNIAFMDYKDFQRNDKGYTFTLRNEASNERAEFYLIVRGLDFSGKTVYRKRIYVDFIEGNGDLMFNLSGHNDRISSWSLEYKKVLERDVRIIEDHTK